MVYAFLYLLGHAEEYGYKGVKEKVADSYARDNLIPPNAFQRFKQTGDYSTSAVIKFSNFIGHDPGIVVGRIFNDKKDYINIELNALRSKYQVVNN